MKQPLIRFALALATVLLLATACGSDSSGSIEISDARYRLSRDDLGAAYLEIFNGTDEAVTLQAAESAGVGLIELHESLAADDGTMMMEPRPEGFTIGAGETVTLEPGGKHLMLFDPVAPEGDLDLELDFGGELVSVVATFDAAASAAAMNSDDDMGDMGDDSMGDDSMGDDSMGDDSMGDDDMGDDGSSGESDG